MPVKLAPPKRPRHDAAAAATLTMPVHKHRVKGVWCCKCHREVSQDDLPSPHLLASPSSGLLMMMCVQEHLSSNHKQPHSRPHHHPSHHTDRTAGCAFTPAVGRAHLSVAFGLLPPSSPSSPPSPPSFRPHNDDGLSIRGSGRGDSGGLDREALRVQAFDRRRGEATLREGEEKAREGGREARWLGGRVQDGM